MTTVVIPWRDLGHRADACRVVCDAYRAALTDVPLLLVDSGHTPFNRAASRNTAIGYLPDDEVVIVADADTIPTAPALLTAVERAWSGRLQYPFTVCHYLTEAGTDLVLRGSEPDPTRIEFSIPGAQGGILVMLAGAWRSVGGMDEAFIGWGYEDNEFHARAATLGPPARHEGVVWHLWHPHDRYTGSAHEAGNLARARGEL